MAPVLPFVVYHYLYVCGWAGGLHVPQLSSSESRCAPPPLLPRSTLPLRYHLVLRNEMAFESAYKCVTALGAPRGCRQWPFRDIARARCVRRVAGLVLILAWCSRLARR